MSKIRRPAKIIFLFTIIFTLTIIKIDLNKNPVEDKYVENDIYIIEKINNQKFYIDLYSDKVLIRIFNQDNRYDLNKFKVGQVIKLDGKLQDNLNNEDISYGLYLKGKGYDYTLLAKNWEILDIKKNFNYYLNSVREYLNNEIIKLYPDINPLVRALITGDRSDLSMFDKNTLSKSGVSHIISISGFHILLIVGILDKVFSFITKRKRYAFILLFTLLYVALIGFQPPCLRAYIFYFTYVLSILSCEKYDTKSICFILASVYMLINPYVIFNMSFTLSFLAVFSISTYYKRFRNYFRRKTYYEKYKNIIDLILLTISAQILTLPYIYFYFNTISIISIISNLISVPLISIAYPFMLMSLLFSKLNIIAKIFSFFASRTLETFIILNRLLIKLPYAYILFADSYIFIIILIYLILYIENRLYEKNKIMENSFEIN